MDSLEALLQSKLFWLTGLCLGFYLYLKHVVYNVWARKGVPHDTPSVPLGNVPLSYFRGEVTHGVIIQRSHEKFKRHRYHGLYLLYEPILVVTDPELARLILVKHFASFYNRGTYHNERNDPLSCALPRMIDDKWKRLRSKLSPTFTSGKLKQMYPLLEEICEVLVRVVGDCAAKEEGKEGIVEMKDVMSRFTIDCISSIAFGCNVNSLQNPDQDFRHYGKISNDFGPVFLLLSFYVPDLLKFYPVPEKRRRVQKFFIQLFEDMVKYRKTENVTRNDFLNSLIELMERGTVEENVSDPDKLSMIEAVAQSVIFFAAGQETTSSAISCCLYELSLNPDIQKQLQEEIDQVFDSDDGMTFENLFEMKYLDMVFCETLRKHPGAPVLNRISAEDFDLPDSTFRVPKGMRLAISVSGLQNDPDVYPEPERFDPTRFTPENKATRHPFAYLPFGEGPRHCIGKRLGVLKTKIALCQLLRNYKFAACAETPPRISYASNFFVQVPADGICLKVERRNAR